MALLAPDPPAVFSLSRDPDDAHYVNLAIATHAMLVVSNDRDLLDLMSATSAEGPSLRQAHPSLRILTPAEFLETL